MPQFLHSCDDDGDGKATFDLTSVAQQDIINGSQVSFFTSAASASANINSISNPESFSITTSRVWHTIYKRVVYTSGYVLNSTFTIFAFDQCMDYGTSTTPRALCSILNKPILYNPSDQSEPGISYGCLTSAIHPMWFYVKAEESGSLNFKVEKTLYNVNEYDPLAAVVCYGPFDTANPGAENLTADKVVYCSGMVSNINIKIPDAQTGKFYKILLTTNSPNNDVYDTYFRIYKNTGTGEADCNVVSLNAFIDNNSNGQQDAGEPDFKYGNFIIQKNNNGFNHLISASQGSYEIILENTSDTFDFSFQLSPDISAYYTIATPPYNDIVTSGNTATYSFAINPVAPYNNVAVYTIGFNNPRPGFENKIMLTYTNLSHNSVPAGTLFFSAPAPYSIVNVSETPTSLSTNNFSFDYTNLLPFETRNIIITLRLPEDAVAGDNVTVTATILPDSNDIDLSNNTSVSSKIIVNSHDPNDKTESRGSKILTTAFSANDYLYYTIRFQNTGRADAINIRIEDVLMAGLDPASVQMLDASHNYSMKCVENRLIWKFDNIMLPGTLNEPLSHGYIYFRIKPTPGFTSGTILSNKAGIYFDFNPAINTNTFTTEFADILAVPILADRSTFILYPNPAQKVVNISAVKGDTISGLKIYDITGKTIYTKLNINAGNLAIDSTAFAKGTYFVEITSGNGNSDVKKLLVQ